VKREERIALTNARTAPINPYETSLNNQKAVRTISGEWLMVRREDGIALT